MESLVTDDSTKIIQRPDPKNPKKMMLVSFACVPYVATKGSGKSSRMNEMI